MSLDAAVHTDSQTALDPFSSALASDPATGIIRHAIKIWAREHGVADDDLSRLTNRVVDFAMSLIHEHKVRSVA